MLTPRQTHSWDTILAEINRYVNPQNTATRLCVYSYCKPVQPTTLVHPLITLKYICALNHSWSWVGTGPDHSCLWSGQNVWPSRK